MPFNWQDIEYGGMKSYVMLIVFFFRGQGVYGIYHCVSMAYTAHDAMVFLVPVNEIDTVP
jgi:hypothetical protein